jgi:CRP-like cAMP-binding protein
VIIDVVGAGHLLGLVAALDGGVQPSHAITATDARLAKIRSGEFMRWVKGQEALWEKLVAEVGLRVRHAYQKIGAHALLSAKERLLMTLIEIAEREGRPDAGASEIIFTRPTHEELARRIGSSREVVTRLLSDLLASDLLWGEGRMLRVPASALVLEEE